jgi:hypothetical protein
VALAILGAIKATPSSLLVALIVISPALDSLMSGGASPVIDQTTVHAACCRSGGQPADRVQVRPASVGKHRPLSATSQLSPSAVLSSRSDQLLHLARPR